MTAGSRNSDDELDYRPSYLAAAITSAIILLLYLVTLAPSTAMWDTSEYIAAAFDLGDDVQVAPFGQHHVRALEEIERPGHFGFSAPRAFRDRRQLAVFARQQRHDPVRFAIVEPMQDDGVGVIGRHGCNSTVAMARCPRSCKYAFSNAR